MCSKKMNILAILILSLLLVTVSLGADPPNLPRLGDIFTGSGNVRIDLGDKNVTGKFTIARWNKKGWGVETETYPSPFQVTTDKALLRYDRNQTFYIRGEADNPGCYVEDRHFNNMSRFWEWLDIASYIGNYTTSDKKLYDFWGTTIGGVQFEFGARRDSPKDMHYFFNRKSETSVFYSFMTYVPHTTTEAANNKEFIDLFKTPEFCG